ncbi:TrmH family RNA methyltransferase [Galbibacter pacificus]|uniref:TrmH family RNA methyltransferase n=1 Tax=Galbibacter pacificus TaxID=2996052 RepID=A0ABT6FPB1_9FLAO|nr:TrmH family RNA methyltransferase [Galbibacter pacificus]MDG3581610.1 TrmH family RNA methyltransferase [Galbibacter pacificus]MDG3585088.1 TrmH family RNA methyltransferase [Galbibacter pacificus]
MAAQLQHTNTPFLKKQFPITIVCDHISSASNIGSIFRLADAFGVEQIIFTGIKPLLSRRMEKTARTTHKTVPYKYIEDENDFINNLKKEKQYIIALEITSNSSPVGTMQLPKNTAIVLVIGNENHGVSKKWLETAHTVHHIEMYGNNSSMNLAHATGICLYELTNKLKI